LLYHHKPQKSKTFAEKQPTRYWRFTITLIGQEQFSTGAFDLEIPGNWDLIHTNYGDFLVPKIDCSIDDALNDIRTATEGTIFAECANAGIIAKMALTNCFIEPAKKNVYNSKAFLQQHMSSLGQMARVSAFQFLHFEKVKDKRTVETGDYVHLKGHPLYTSLNPTGSHRGQNVYMVGYGVDNLRMYVGFGDFFKDGPKTARQIQERLAEDYISELTLLGETADQATVLGEIRAIRHSHAFLKVSLQAKPAKSAKRKAKKT
jgi:hypothetical protein